MKAQSNIHIIPGARKSPQPEPNGKKARNPHRVVSPQFRAIIAEECRQRGSVATAHAWGITVSAALECRIEAISKVLAQTRELLARLERKAA